MKNKTTITVKVSLQAPIERVWKMWTSPEYITQWNFASDDWQCPKAENDLKPGGKFSWKMEAKDGSMGFDFRGTYEQVIEQELITFRLEDNREVRITFSKQGNQIKLSESFDAEGTNSDEMQRAGWQAILENFKRLVESEKE